ncbi:hypothetical protein CUMW_224920 [Citrus unshiu]|uniref:Uncharacterized protein n=1 Tax=Citrus unshiu TaxID=55188 RepID=A0A2H5QFG0_CITUN|nr:hypothetical protein CUMW_224920 [Citrus unshiu]
MDAKFIEDVWKVGVRVGVDGDGIVRRDDIESCIREVMEGKSGREMKMNAKKWRDLAIEAVSEGGTSRGGCNADHWGLKPPLKKKIV